MWAHKDGPRGWPPDGEGGGQEGGSLVGGPKIVVGLWAMGPRLVSRVSVRWASIGWAPEGGYKCKGPTDMGLER